MSEDPHKIRAAMRTMVESLGINGRPSLVCKVTEVDWTAKTCTCVWDQGQDDTDTDGNTGAPAADTSTGLELFDVRLRSVADNADTGIICKPAIGSYVTVELVEEVDSDYYVAQYSELDQIDIKIGQTTITIKDGKVEFNGGNNKGLVLLQPTVKAFKALQDDVNNLKTALNTVLNTTINTAPSGSPDLWQIAMKAGLSAWVGQRLTVTQDSDLENTKITQ